MSVELRVTEAEVGSRLDVLLVRRVDGMSRARARRMIEEGEVRVNGRRVRKGARLAEGDQVELGELPPPRDFGPAPNADLPLAVRHEDERVVVVDKPGGLPCHPLRPSERRTLANGLVARYPEMVGVGPVLREAGLVHRLDNDTSGLVMAARDAAAFAELRGALKAGRIDKRYLALVAGPYTGPERILLPVEHHPSDPRRVHVPSRPKRPTRERLTEVEVLRAIGPYELLEVRARVATRHQIRVHLAAVGHPLVGDWLYGGPAARGLGRHFLHASEIRLPHPDGHEVRVVSPLAPDLDAALGEAVLASA